jgi:hypothetical protein
LRKVTRWPVFVSCVAGAALAIAGCQQSTSAGSANTETPTTVAAAKVPEKTTATPAAAPPAKAAAPDHWTMPNLVGAGLQQAQDRIQALTGDAVFFTSSHDATGQNRHQVVDSNWKVCSQNIAPGTQITAGDKIDFGAVKLSESCP